MSSAVRILKLQNCVKVWTGNNFKVLNGCAQTLGRIHGSRSVKFNFPTHIASTSVVRTYAVQYPRTDQDSLNEESKESKQYANIDAEFEYTDSLLRRGIFLKRTRIEELMKGVASSDDVTPSQALFLLRCCGSNASLETEETRSKLASRIWNNYLDKGVPLDISHYNALLQVYVESETEFSPLDFLATLRDKNIEPNRITYSRLIYRYCQIGDIDGANKILEFMKEKEFALNEYIFNALLLGNSRANNLEGAVAILDIMKQSGLAPGSDTYTVLIQSYAEHNKLDELEKLLKECLQEDKLNDRSIMDIICILANKKLTSLVEKVFSNLKQDGANHITLKPTTGRLIQAGHEELAFKLFKTFPFNVQANYQGNFFPKQLATSGLDLHKVVSYCEEIRSNGWNILAYELALETYLQEHKFKVAMDLIRVMKEKNITIREHYFYPIILDAGKANNRDVVYNLLEEIVQFDIQLSMELYSGILLPSLKPSNDIADVQAIFNHLMNNQRDFDRLDMYNGFVEFLMRKYDLESTALFVSRYRRGVFYSLTPFLADIFLSSFDHKATACILHQTLPVSVRLQKDVEENIISSQYSGMKIFLRVAINGLKKQNLLEVHLLPLLKAMVAEGSYLIPSVIEYIVSEIGDAMTPEIQETLEKLSNFSEMCSAMELQEGSQAGRMSIRKKIELLEDKGEVDAELNIILAITLIRQRKLGELSSHLDKLKTNGIDLPPPVKILLLECYVQERMNTEAEALFNNIRDNHPDFQISSEKIMMMARIHVEMEKYDDAIKCLLMNSPEDGRWPFELKPRFEHVSYRNRVINMLNDVAAKSDLATLKLMQETLFSRSYAPASWIFPSLIHYHIKENLDEAMAAFVKIAEEHKITAGKSELTVACIKEEDTDKIQQIIDISNQIHGDMNTLYDLVFSFVEAGKLKQAEKVLQTSGVRTLQDKLDGRCESYLRNKKIAHLEGIISVTKGVFNIDRQRLYNYLLKGYISADDPDNALGIWNRMQEESVDPDSFFLLTLNDFLVSKGLEVPFVVPSQKTINRLSQQITTERVPNQRRSPNYDEQLTSALNSQEIFKVEEIYRRAKDSGTKISPGVISRIIALRLRNGKLAEAIEEAKKLMLKNTLPSIQVLCMLLRELELRGDTATIQFLGKYMDDKLKWRTFYLSSVQSSQIVNGLGEELINENIKVISEAALYDEVKLKVITNVAFSLILQKQPELYSQLEKLAELFNEKGKSRLLELLFEHNFLKGNREESERLYDTHLKDHDNFRIREICSHSLQETDVSKLDELLEVLNRKPEGRENCKGYLYSAYIDVLSKEGKFEEALKVIEKSLQSVKLENYKRSSLSDLKKKMIFQNLSFPYEIPRSERKDLSSSSSSSDDEK